MFAILPTLPHHCLSSFPSVIQVHLPPAYPLNQTWVFYPCYLAHSPPLLPLLSRSTSLPLILIPVMAAFLSLPRNFQVSHTTHYSLLTTQVWGRCALPSVHRTPSIQILELLVEVSGPSEPWLLTFDDCIVRRWKWWSPWWWLLHTRMIMINNYIYVQCSIFFTDRQVNSWSKTSDFEVLHTTIVSFLGNKRYTK